LTSGELEQERRRDDQDRLNAETWTQNPRPELVDRIRSRAFLAGYVALCGVEFSANAIECADGRYIRPDMQVMKAFCCGGYVTYNDVTGRFQLSLSGEQLIGLVPS
jgi:hypothetical protein